MAVENAKLTKTGLSFEDATATSISEYSHNAIKFKNNDVINFETVGVVDFKTNKIINIGTPTGSSDVATKNYVDTLANGLLIKEAVVTATTGPVTLTDLIPGFTVDKVDLVLGDRVLVKDQSDEKTNGVYVVQASGAPVRSLDLDEPNEFKNGVHVFVVGVTDVAVPANTSVNANLGFVIVTPNATDVFVVGSNDIVWRRFSKQGVHTFDTTAGFLTANGVDISLDPSHITTAANNKFNAITDVGTGSLDTRITTLSDVLVGADGRTGTILGHVGDSIDAKVLALNEVLTGTSDPTDVGLVGDNTKDITTNKNNITINTDVLDTGNLINTSMVFWDGSKLETIDGMKYDGSKSGLIVPNLTCTSDRTKKTNIKTIDNSNLIHQLRPVEYNWKDTKMDQRVKYGFIAQEVAEIFPSVVNKTDGVFGVEYINLISHLVMEVQTMRKELDELKK